MKLQAIKNELKPIFLQKLYECIDERGTGNYEKTFSNHLFEMHVTSDRYDSKNLDVTVWTKDNDVLENLSDELTSYIKELYDEYSEEYFEEIEEGYKETREHENYLMSHLRYW